MGRKLAVTIDNDPDADMPGSESDDWKLKSFNRRHGSYEDPDKYIVGYDRETRTVKPSTIGLRRKLEVGLAFWLSYFEHGDGAWSLIGEGTQCQWDTAYLAGLLLRTGKPGDIGAKTYEDRAEDARGFLEEFSAWANGHCYFLEIKDQSDKILLNCGGFIGTDHLEGVLAEELEPGDKIWFEGDCADLGEYLTLPKGVKIIEKPDHEEVSDDCRARNETRRPE
jgi:hypothetical protein